MKDNGAVCPYLWDHHCVNVSNLVTPCCRVDYHQIKNDGIWWEDTKISEGIWSKNHIETREQMRQGDRPNICKVCWDLEDKGLKSGRLSELERMHRDQRVVDFSLEPTQVRTMDIKFNNTCNLACRMCNPGSSSLINKLAQELPENDRFNNQRHILGDRDSLEDEKLTAIKNHIANGATEFKTTGGEPFVQPHFIELIDWCFDNDYHTHLDMKITSNLIGLNTKLLDQLKQFKSLYINISIDGYGDTYEYIRYPAKWDKLDKNLRNYIDVMQQQNNLMISLSALLQSYNIFNLDSLYEYWTTELGLSEKMFAMDCQLKPVGKSEIAVENLPKHLIEQAIEETNIQELRDYLRTLNPSEDGNIEKLKEFARRTIAYDKQRGQDYRVLDPRIVDLIDKHK